MIGKNLYIDGSSILLYLDCISCRFVLIIYQINIFNITAY